MSIVSEANEIQLNNAFPLTNEEGMRLEPFKITIKNTCNVFASFTVNLEVLEGSTLQSKYLKGQVNREEPTNLASLETTTLTITNSLESRILARGSLGSDDEEDYTVRLWMDESVTLVDTDALNKTFRSKIIITGQPSTYSPVEQGITKLSEAMLANEYQTSVEKAKEKIAAKNTPDFSKTAPIIEWQEIKETNEITVTADMPHPSLNGNASLGGQDLTEDSQKILLGKNYTFDKTSGHYFLQERITVDPTTINDYGSQDYYYCISGTNVGSTGIISVYHRYAECVAIYRVNNVVVSDYGLENTNEYRRRYTIKAYALRQIELESDKSDKGLYQAADDLGVSYYYRGNVKNNFVKFAGYYWRIIRRNGDGTVRLIYNGLNTNLTEESTQIGKLVFNGPGNNPSFVGYMYGTTLNTSAELTNANETNSNMKTFLEIWYAQKLSMYDAYIADAIFCNDRSINEGTGYTTNSTTYYGPFQRLYFDKAPKLTCPQTGDKFTVSESLGNGKNIYPVGLVTVDELSMAGVVAGYLNRLFYLGTDYDYWTMTSAAFRSDFGYSFGWKYAHDGRIVDTGVSFENGVRPVINLKADVEITGGIGTANDPFVVRG